MTRQEITDYITEELQEYEGTPMYGSPNALQRQITTVTDELARLAKGVYQIYRMDLVAGQAVYCATPLLKILAATAADSLGNALNLSFITARSLLEMTGARATAPATGSPYYYASEGTNRFEVYPVPNYSTTGNPATGLGYGLVLEGFGVPGDSWAALSAACPLPANQHMGVVYGALVKRCQQFPRQLGDRIPGYEKTWTWYKGHAESQVAVQTPADRQRGQERLGGRIFGRGPLDNDF
jgi:hypothetical protein